jgi:CheY-like chemotaxis protein
MTAMPTTSVARKRILCVDDHEDTRDMMQVLLDHYGYEAVVATSVPDALKTARSGGLSLYYLIIG